MSGLVEATYIDGNVIIPSQGDADTLQQKGYGVKRKKKRGIALSPHEALYLLEQKKICVIKKRPKVDMSFSELLEEYRASESALWTRYLIYKDLRDRGYVAKEECAHELGFEVYERGEHSLQDAKYIVLGISEGTPTPIDKLSEILKSVKKMGKELILAVIDRRNEVIYYSLSELGL